MEDAYQESSGVGEAPAGDSYDPGSFLNTLLDTLNLKGDAELAKKLKMEKALLGKIRDGQLQISGSMLILIQEATGIAVPELRRMLKDRRTTSRMAYRLEQRR